jgi:hypothetical protein
MKASPRVICGVVSAVILSTLSIGVQAAPLPPGTAFPAAAEPDPTGGIVVGFTNVAFAAPSFSGTLISTVYLGDPSNPFGGLTFTYQITNDPGSVDPIGRLTINGWDLLPTDASFQIPLAGAPPTTTLALVGLGLVGVLALRRCK